MAASYPGTIKTFSTKESGQAIASSHINDLQDEVKAVETALGTNAGAWQNWTPTVTGWSTISVGDYRYTTVGKFVFVTIRIQGVSNSTSIVVTLPKPAGNYGSISAFGYGYDNDAALSTPCYLYGVSATEVKVLKNPTGAPWTGSNAKRINVQFGYEAA